MSEVSCIYPGTCGQGECKEAGLCFSRLIAAGAGERRRLGVAVVKAMSRPEVERFLWEIEQVKGLEIELDTVRVKRPERGEG